MSRTRGREDAEARVTKRVASRAVRRLGVLEWATLAGAGSLAMLGGAIAAAVAAGPLGFSFRTVWAVASLLLFAVPMLLVLWKTRREERSSREKVPTENDGSHV